MKKLLVSSILLLMVGFLTGQQEAKAQSQQEDCLECPRVELAFPFGFGLDVPNQVGDPGSLSISASAYFHLLRFGKHKTNSLIVSPNFDYFLIDSDADATGMQFGADLIGRLGRSSGFFRYVNPYGGVGLALSIVTDDDAQAALQKGTNIGLNVLFGSTYGAGSPRLFTHLRLTLGDHNLHTGKDQIAGSGWTFQGGILFKID